MWYTLRWGWRWEMCARGSGFWKSVYTSTSPPSPNTLSGSTCTVGRSLALNITLSLSLCLCLCMCMCMCMCVCELARAPLSHSFRLLGKGLLTTTRRATRVVHRHPHTSIIGAYTAETSYLA